MKYIIKYKDHTGEKRETREFSSLDIAQIAEIILDKSPYIRDVSILEVQNESE